jgi:hypothetical protein
MRMPLMASPSRARCLSGARNPQQSGEQARVCRHIVRCKARDEELAEWDKFFESNDLGADQSIKHLLNQRARRKKEEEPPVSGSCYGCGVTLQIANPDGLGYVHPNVYWRKREHKQQSSMLCARCCLIPRALLIARHAAFATAHLHEDMTTRLICHGSDFNAFIISKRGKEGKSAPSMLLQAFDVHAVCCVIPPFLSSAMAAGACS